MNLHAIVAPIIGAVNANVMVTIKPSAGYTTNADGTRTPKYGPAVQMKAQIQQSLNALEETDGLNLQAQTAKIYLYGEWNGVVRPELLGGDLITFPDGSIWLVTTTIEAFGGASGWVSVTATRQNGA